ncbi:MAG: arylamine N-acetyltransferase [Halanaeroarchaeum sp.]
MNADAYLDRIGLSETAEALDPTVDALSRLLTAHARRVPFENLAIVGHPRTDAPGPGISLRLPDLFGKIVTRRRGGFCFEVNGLFHWLLDEVGFDVDRCSARIGGDENSLGRPPANHHTNVVHLDRRYIADVGTGIPQVRVPVPLDGTVVADEAGARWRVDPSEKPLSDHALRLQRPGAEEWELRYRFRTTPRALSYFEATCEYLANEPDGTFTSGPVVQRSTADGAIRLDEDTLTRYEGGTETAEPVAAADWTRVLEEEFRIRLDGENSGNR